MTNFNYDVATNKVMSGDKALTKKEVFALMREAFSDNEAFQMFIDHEVDLLNKERKPSKKDMEKKEANRQLFDAIIKVLDKDGLTGEEIADKVGVTKQKIASVLSNYGELDVDYIKTTRKVKTASGKTSSTVVYAAVV